MEPAWMTKRTTNCFRQGLLCLKNTTANRYMQNPLWVSNMTRMLLMAAKQTSDEGTAEFEKRLKAKNTKDRECIRT